MVNGQGMFATSDWLKMGAAFCLGPALIGGIMTFVFAGAVESHPWLPKAGIQLLYGAFLTAITAPVVLALFALLLRFGIAGWVVLLSIATFCAGGAWLSSGDGPLYAIFATWLHAFCLWWCAHAIEPDALAARVNQT